MIDIDAEKDAFLAHYGVPGMRWGKRKAGGAPSPRQERKAAAKARYSAYEKNPTGREFALGVGKTRQERTESRKIVGKAAAIGILATTAAKLAVATIPQLAPAREGVNALANTVQSASWAVGAYSLAAEGIDRATSR